VLGLGPAGKNTHGGCSDADDVRHLKDLARAVDQTDARQTCPESGYAGQGLVDGQVPGATPVRVAKGVAEATFTVEFFARGNFTFNVQYLGSSRFQGSICNTLTVNVF
jgi:hypothetical protein